MTLEPSALYTTSGSRNDGDPQGRPAVSVVVPVFNEEANVGPLVSAIRDALGSGSWELVLVDDGSSDDTVPAV